MFESSYVREGEPFQPSAAMFNSFIDAVKAVKGSRSQYGLKPGFSDENLWYFGTLTSTLGFGSFSSPTTATVDMWLPDWTSGSNPPPLIVTTDTSMLGLTVVNPWKSLHGAIGDQCSIEQRYGFWFFKLKDC